MTFIKYLLNKKFREAYKEKYTGEIMENFNNEQNQLESIYSGFSEIE